MVIFLHIHVLVFILAGQMNYYVIVYYVSGTPCMQNNDGEVPGLVVTGMMRGEGEEVGGEEGSSDVGEEFTEEVVGSGQEGSVACEQMRGLVSEKTRKLVYSILSDVTPADETHSKA